MERIYKLILKGIEKWMSNKIRKRASSVLAFIVVFITVYSLILPAITLERSATVNMPGTDAGKTFVYDCNYQVHKHTKNCYENRPVYDADGKKTGTEKVLICGKADWAVHVHDDNCYQTVTRTVVEDGVEKTITENVLVCTLPEIEEHKHTSDCYAENGDLICGQPELHTHTIDCYEHGPKEQSPEEMGWIHYETDADGNRILVGDPKHLICGKLELLAHQHDAHCFRVEEVPVSDVENEAEVNAMEAEGVSGEEGLTGAESISGQEGMTDAESLTDVGSGEDGGAELGLEVASSEERHAAAQAAIGVPETEQKTSDADNSIISDVIIEKTVAVEGASYELKVAYGEESNIPDDARFVATAIAEDNQVYETYRDRAISAVDEKLDNETQAAKDLLGLFDLSIYDADENPVQPEASLDVTVDFGSDIDESNNDVYAVHFQGNKDSGKVSVDEAEVEVIDTDYTGEKAASVSFAAEELPVYAIVGTAIEKTVLASDGKNYKVTVTYGPEANLPDDVDLDVAEIDKNDEAYMRYLKESAAKLDKEANAISYARIFDISLVSKDNKDIHYQPDSDVAVSIELADMEKSQMSSLRVLHISEDKIDIMDADTDGNALHFQTDSFSIYPIINEPGENARIAYRFWYNDGSQEILLSTQYFRYKDVHPDDGNNALTINEPSIPGVEAATWNRIFRGWSKTDYNDDDSNLKTVAALNDELQARAENDYTEGTIIDVYANLKDVYYVTYVDVNPNNILATEIVPLAESGDTTFTVKPESQLRPTIDSDTVLLGWYDINHPETVYSPGQENVVIDSNVTLYPKIEGGYWLTFDDNDPVWDENKQTYVSGGASFTPPAFYMDEVTQQPADPTWAGYEFDGWYKDKECTEPFVFGQTLDHDTTVYAKWNPSASQYRVIYWKQRTTDAWDAADEDKTYDYADSRLVTDGVVTGQIVELAASDTRVYGAGGSSGESDQDYFTYNAGKTDQSIVVKADGSSVINVYYDRQVITINFTGNLYHYEETTDTSGELYAHVDGEYVRVYPDGNGGYKTRTTRVYVYNTDTVYDGTRYNSTNVRNNNDPVHYGIVNGREEPVELYRYSNNYWYYDTTYDRWGYVSSLGTRYTGTHYIINASGTYGYINNQMVQIEERTISESYTGTIYKRVTQNGLTLKGLYGRSMYPGEWPTSLNGSAERWWRFANNNGGNTTLNAPWNSYTISPAASSSQINNRTWTLSGTDKSSGQNIYYYGEDLEGNYTVLLAETGRANNTSLTVNSEKFYGYHTSYWTYGLNGSRNELNGGATSISSSYYSTTTPLYIYYARDKFSLTFYSNNGSNQTDVIKDIPYEKPLTEYATHSEGQKNGYYFLGWYADPSCTEPFDFAQTMPHNNVAVYGKWKMERFRIVLDPGASNVYMGSQATRFRLDYDETMDGGLMETATRAGYILDGWYTDPDFTNRFLFTNPVNSSTPGVDMTYQTSSAWAAAREAYGDDDEAHENVRGILHLYAKWIPDPTSIGINVVYDPGDAALYDSLGDLQTIVPVDTHMYGFDGTTTAREAPSNYNDLYTFKYWVATREVIGEDGTSTMETITIHPGDPVSLENLTFTDPIYDENGELLRKTVTLRAVYDLTGDPSRITHITYDGDTIKETKYGTGEEQTIHGVTKDGTNRLMVTLDEEINQTIILPDEDDFYLNGYTLVGWSFFEGSLEEQKAALEDYNAAHPDNQLTDFTPGQEVAADNLDQGPVNDHENTLYAMWQPKTYTVTVKQVIENGVPDHSFDYDYKIGEENAISTVQDTVKTLTGNTFFTVEDLEYYDRSGTVIRIPTPVIPDDAPYSVRVNAIVTKDDGITEILNPTALGDYQILGDVVITYTYSMKVPVKLRKRDATDHNTVLTNAVFTVTPVEYNSSTQHWENAGSGITLAVTGNELEQYLQEGTYRIVETTAPDNYAKIGTELYMTVRKDEDFTLFSENGSDINSDIAELIKSGGTFDTLTVYDNPIRNVTLSKTVEDQEEGSFEFTVTVFEKDGTSRLGNYTIGNVDGNDLVTNNIGEVRVSLSHGQSITLKIPHECWLTVEEKENVRYKASYKWNTEDNVEENVFGNDPVRITSDNTLAYTNSIVRVPVVLKKVGINNTDADLEEWPLTGASFTLYKEDKTSVVAENLTSEGTDAVFFVDKLKIGTYYLEETSVPPGYNGPAGMFKLEVSLDHDKTKITGDWISGDPDNVQGTVTGNAEDGYIITVRNVAGFQLPSTGGSGTRLIYLIGSILMAIALAGLLLTRRRNAKM